VGIKKFTDVTRNLHCDVGDIFGSRFAIFVKRYGLFDSGNSGKGSGERINLKPQDFFDQLASHARPEQDAHNHRIQQVFDPCHALVAIGKRLLNCRIPFTTNGNVNVYFGGGIVNHGLRQYFGFGFSAYHACAN
jgi:hypothetical protein